jgi:hypothetical protein
LESFDHASGLVEMGKPGRSTVNAGAAAFAGAPLAGAATGVGVG